MVQRVSTSLARKDSSSALSLGVYVSSSFFRLGEPLKMSRSKPTLPQPRATRSVSLILGIAFWASLKAAPAMNPRDATCARGACTRDASRERRRRVAIHSRQAGRRGSKSANFVIYLGRLDLLA